MTKFKENTFDDIAVKNDKFCLHLSYAGEGYFGDYSRDNEEDEPLLRMDVFACEGCELVPIDDGSYCTQLVANVSLRTELKAAAQLMLEFLTEMSTEGVRNQTLQQLSHTYLDDDRVARIPTLPDTASLLKSPQESNVYEFKVTGSFGTVDKSLKELRGFNGEVVGFILPNGDRIRAIFALELEKADDTYTYITSESEMAQLGFKHMTYDETNFRR